MRLYVEGDRGQAICETCHSIVEMKYETRCIEIKKIILFDMLVGVCENCDNTIIIPAQSTQSIREQLESHKLKNIDTDE